MNETVNWFPVVNSPVSSVSLIIRRCEGPHQELLGVAHEVRALSWQAFFWRVKGRSLLDWDFVDPAKQDSANAVHKHSHEQSIAPLMPIRPFPVPLRVGVDVCNISRIRRIIAHNESVSSDRLERFLKRILTKPERLYFWDRFGPACRIGEKHGTVSEYLAGRFAAKEAIRKAANHFHKDVRGLHEIIILPILVDNHVGKKSVAPQGLILDHGLETEYLSPTLQYCPTTVETRSLDAYHGQLCEISISHDGDVATAVALVPTMTQENFT